MTTFINTVRHCFSNSQKVDYFGINFESIVEFIFFQFNFSKCFFIINRNIISPLIDVLSALKHTVTFLYTYIYIFLNFFSFNIKKSTSHQKCSFMYLLVKKSFLLFLLKNVGKNFRSCINVDNILFRNIVRKKRKSVSVSKISEIVKSFGKNAFGG